MLLAVLGVSLLMVIWPGPPGATTLVQDLAPWAMLAWAVPISLGGIRWPWPRELPGSRAQLPRLLLALVVVYQFPSLCLSAYDAYIVHQPYSPQSIFDSVSYILVVAVIVLLPQRGVPAMLRLRVGLDSVIIMTALLTFSWYYLLGPMLEQASADRMATAAALLDPFGDLLAIACLLRLLPHIGRTVAPLTVLLAALTIGVDVLTNVLTSYQILHHAQPWHSLMMLSQVCVLTGLALISASLQHLSPRAAEAAEGTAEIGVEPVPTWQTALTYGLALATGILFLYTWQRPGSAVIATGVGLGGVALIILIMLRQALALSEHRQLYTRLTAAHRETVALYAQAQALTEALAAGEQRERQRAQTAEVLAAELLARQERLSALQSIAASLATTRTPDEIGTLVVRMSALFLNAAFVIIRTLSADGAWLELLVTNSGNDSGSFPDRRPYQNDSLSGEVMRTGQPIWPCTIAEMTTRFPGVAPVLATRGYADTLALPLLIEGRAIGTLGLFFVQPQHITTEDRAFLVAVAGLIAQALDRARLYVQEQGRAQAAEDVARLRGDFVASVSHELRTPLTAIVGYAELLEARWSMMSEAARLEQVRRIAWSANRQMRLVQDLLLVSRLDLQALSLDCTPTDLAAQVRLAVTELQGSYRGQPVQVSGPRSIQVRADASRVVQILVNLLDNAAKYSPEGTPIEVRWDAGATEAMVWVQDHGPGIPAEGRAQLFARFGRIAGSRIRSGRVGTGLGLFLGRQLARAMAGDLALEATSAQGSVFCLRLPLVLAAPPEPTRQTDPRTLLEASGVGAARAEQVRSSGSSGGART